MGPTPPAIGMLALFDASTNAPYGPNINLGVINGDPDGVAFTSTGSYFYVTNHGDDVAVYNTITGAGQYIESAAHVEGQAGVAVSPVNGSVYVAGAAAGLNGQVAVIS